MTKRARFAIPGQPTLLQDTNTPTGILQSHLCSAFVTLHYTISTLAKEACTRCVKLFNTERNQRDKLAKLRNDDYVPRSANFAFTLKTNRRVSEKDAFKTLASAQETAIKVFQASIKANIVQVVNLEQLDTRDEIHAHFSLAAFNFAKIILIESNPSDEDPSEAARVLALSTVHLHPALLQYCHMERLDFYENYKSVNKCDKPTFDGSNIDATEIAAIEPYQATLFLVLSNIFVQPWKLICKLKEQQEKTKALEHFSKTLANGAATEACAMEIDKETSVSAATLNDLITAKVSAETMALRKQIDKLSQQLKRSTATSTPAKNANGAKTPITTPTLGAKKPQKQLQFPGKTKRPQGRPRIHPLPKPPTEKEKGALAAALAKGSGQKKLRKKKPPSVPSSPTNTTPSPSRSVGRQKR